MTKLQKNAIERILELARTIELTCTSYVFYHNKKDLDEKILQDKDEEARKNYTFSLSVKSKIERLAECLLEEEDDEE